MNGGQTRPGEVIRRVVPRPTYGTQKQSHHPSITFVSHATPSSVSTLSFTASHVACAERPLAASGRTLAGKNWARKGNTTAVAYVLWGGRGARELFLSLVCCCRAVRARGAALATYKRESGPMDQPTLHRHARGQDEAALVRRREEERLCARHAALPLLPSLPGAVVGGQQLAPVVDALVWCGGGVNEPGRSEMRSQQRYTHPWVSTPAPPAALAAPSPDTWGRPGPAPAPSRPRRQRRGDSAGR